MKNHRWHLHLFLILLLVSGRASAAPKHTGDPDIGDPAPSLLAPRPRDESLSPPPSPRSVPEDDPDLVQALSAHRLRVRVVGNISLTAGAWNGSVSRIFERGTTRKVACRLYIDGRRESLVRHTPIIVRSIEPASNYRAVVIHFTYPEQTSANNSLVCLVTRPTLAPLRMDDLRQAFVGAIEFEELGVPPKR